MRTYRKICMYIYIERYIHIEGIERQKDTEIKNYRDIERQRYKKIYKYRE